MGLRGRSNSEAEIFLAGVPGVLPSARGLCCEGQEQDSAWPRGPSLQTGMVCTRSANHALTISLQNGTAGHVTHLREKGVTLERAVKNSLAVTDHIIIRFATGNKTRWFMCNGFILETLKDNCFHKRFKDHDSCQMSDLPHVKHPVCVSESLRVKEKDTKFNES